MEAYASVDMATRRKMDEMLKTWKEPIPGSIDTRPVFPPDVTRPIENALLQARASGNEQVKRMMGQGRQAPPQGMPYRDTPTPPGVRPPTQANGYPGGPPPAGMNGNPYGQPPQQQQQQQQPPPAQYPYQQVCRSLPGSSRHLLTHDNQQPSRSTPQPPANTPAFQPPPYHGGGYGMPAQPMISVEALKDDIQSLITTFKAEFARNPQDPSVQTKLKALLDLQGILQAQNLPQEQLVLIKNQIAGLAVTVRAPPAQTPTPVPIPQPVAVNPPPAAAAPKVSLDSLFGSGTLAALLARGSSVTPQISTPPPPPPATTVAIRSSPPPQRTEPPQSATPSTDPKALMDMLRKAGVLPATTPASSNTMPVPPLSATPASLPFPLPMVPVPGGPPSMEHITGDIALTASSLKK